MPEGLATQELKREKLLDPSTGADRYRRGVYVNVQRTFPHPMLAAFDVADGNEACARRDRSNTPIQALTLLNDPAFVECAIALGKRLLNISHEPRDRIRIGFQLCLARTPSDEEVKLLATLWEDQYQYYLRDPQAAETITQWCDDRRTKPAEAAAWIGVARCLLKLDEFLVRE